MNTGVLKKGIATCFAFLALAIIARSETFEETKAKAEKGDAVAQLNLGGCYAGGRGVQKDKAEAVKWYLKAAEQSNAMAQVVLATCYDHGNGVEKNAAEAVKWYRKAAEQGNAWGQFGLAICYDRGVGVTKNEDEAIKWFSKAAASDDPQVSPNAKSYIKELKRRMAEDAQAENEK